MILYALRCAEGHQFDAWFRNGGAYDALAAAGDVLCPICGSSRVDKAPMAPRIGKSRGDDVQPPAMADSPRDIVEVAEAITPAPADVEAAAMRQALSALRAHVEASFDYVGERFPEEARRIHYNETPARPIYGEATPAEAEALQEEGVTLRRIPWLSRSDS